METIALTVLVLSTSLSMLLVPDLHAGSFVEPTVQAAVVTPFFLSAVLALRFTGAPPIWERRAFALFLASMPLVYLGSLALHGADRSWLTIELVGLLLFAAMAWVGLRRSAWVLVVGLAAHGLVWDFSHHGRTTFMPDWYAWGCLIVDVGYAFYAATRVAVWERSASAARAGGLGQVGLASRVSV